MNEKLLQYLWNYKIFTHFNFQDVEGVSIEVLDFGKWNHDAGPDFYLAKIRIGNITLVGNIELHVKTSDWNHHHHENNSDFDNLILHVVYENDQEIVSLKNKNITTLELKNYISLPTLSRYQQLNENNKFIPCENIFDVQKIPFHFAEESVLNKLQEKSWEIKKSLVQYKNDYEAVLFHYLAYNFGLSINAEIFKEIAESIDFKVIQKIRNNNLQLEVLLFGYSGWLENPQDENMKKWKSEFEFLQSKFNIQKKKYSPKFLRLRPQNFPTIRFSQLANLYHQHQNVFSKLVQAKNIQEIFTILNEIQASEYWNTHFNFGKISTQDYPKKLSKDFIHSIIINTILPFKYSYQKFINEEAHDEIIEMYKQISAEKNTIISEWKNIGFQASNSLESQAFLYHYKHFCVQKKCLNCGICFKLLKDE